MATSRTESLVYQFDSFCRKTLRNEARNYYKAMKRKADREISLSELSGSKELGAFDRYPSEEQSFLVRGYRFTVQNELLADALQALPGQNRDIVLLSFFLELTDQEISDLLNVVRRTVQYRRMSSLREMRRRLEVNDLGK